MAEKKPKLHKTLLVLVMVFTPAFWLLLTDDGRLQQRLRLRHNQTCSQSVPATSSTRPPSTPWWSLTPTSTMSAISRLWSGTDSTESG